MEQLTLKSSFTVKLKFIHSGIEIEVTFKHADFNF